MPTNPFSTIKRQWTRVTDAVRATSTVVLAPGELAVTETGKVFGGNGGQFKNLSPLIDAATVSATYVALDGNSRLAIAGTELTAAQIGAATPAQASGAAAGLAIVFGS